MARAGLQLARERVDSLREEQARVAFRAAMRPFLFLRDGRDKAVSAAALSGPGDA
jgi:hypothetical protein